MGSDVRVMVAGADAGAQGELTHALRVAGYLVETAGDLADAARVASWFRPDVVVLERAAGEDTVTALRRLSAVADPLVIVTTDDAESERRIAAYASGADDYVQHPFTVEELVVRVHAVLRRTARGTSRVHLVGRLVVDEDRHVASYDGELLDLPPKAFAILATLASHPGQVLSKRVILDRVWGFDAFDENLVEVHVATLRKALAAAGAHLIHTIRGVGYVMRGGHDARHADRTTQSVPTSGNLQK